jgi:RNA polymerase sigma-54 factor
MQMRPASTSSLVRAHLHAEFLQPFHQSCQAGSLDDKGYLAVKVEDVTYEMNVSVDKVRAVLRVLQAQEPVGIGARNLRECLSIQIQHLDERGISRPHAYEIVTQFLTELGEHKFGRIAHELKISQQEVSDVWEFVKTKLNPHPAHGFSSTNASDRVSAPAANLSWV